MSRTPKNPMLKPTEQSPPGDEISTPLTPEEIGERKRLAMEAELAAEGKSFTKENKDGLLQNPSPNSSSLPAPIIASVDPADPKTMAKTETDFPGLDDVILHVSRELESSFNNFESTLERHEELARKNDHRTVASLLANLRKSTAQVHKQITGHNHAAPKVF